MKLTLLARAIVPAFLILGATPSKAITFVWNGSATYDCINGVNGCSVTATDFTLDYNTGTNTWSNGYSPTGSLLLYGGSPANSAQYTNAANTYFVTTADLPSALNNSTAFTISPNAVFNSGLYFTFYLTSAPTGVANEAVSLYAIGSPDASTNNLRPTGGYATLSPTILGQSAPAPLGLFALFPFFRMIKRRSGLALSTHQ